MNNLAVVILAAGQGKRMKSSRAKVLHPVVGRPMIYYSLDVARALKPERTVVVVGVQADEVKAALAGAGVKFALQKEQKGTGHAVMSAMPALKGFTGDVVVFYGDGPCLRPEPMRELVAMHRKSRAAMSLLTADFEGMTGFGRIVRGGQGRIMAIVEERDCTPEQKAIQESNPGLYCYRMDFLKKYLRLLKNNNVQGEYYLTDLVALAVGRGLKVSSAKVLDNRDLGGVNSRWELARAEAIIRERINRGHADAGVSIEQPETVHIESCAVLCRDAVIEPGARIGGSSRIEEGARIEMNARVIDSKIGKGAVIEMGARVEQSVIGEGARIKAYSVIESSVVKARAAIGPMAHLRPGSDIGEDCKLGNFVETKKAVIGRDTKISHLTYVGDAEVGKNCNLACGFITCNYDGVNKFQTIIEDGVFVGSDSQAIAPVKIGKGAYVASGTTITRDVPPGSLAIARVKQANIEGWAARKKKKQAEFKKGK